MDDYRTEILGVDRLRAAPPPDDPLGERGPERQEPRSAAGLDKRSVLLADQVVVADRSRVEGVDGSLAEGEVVGPAGPVMKDDQLAGSEGPGNGFGIQGRRARMRPCQ